jgi:hypothetical protein
MYQVLHTVSREPPYLFYTGWTRSGHPVALAALHPFQPFNANGGEPESGHTPAGRQAPGGAGNAERD